MPRLVPSSGPVDRNEQPWQSREEHEAWVRGVYEKHHPGETPAPCDCGYYSDDWLVLCGGRARVHCKEGVAERLAKHHRWNHERNLSQKRKFPGLPPNTEKQQCWWCKKPIVHGRAWQRSMHDGRLDEPNCRWVHDLHTDRDMQESYLLRRDGHACQACSGLPGSWGHWPGPNLERVRAYGPSWVAHYPPDVFVGDHTRVAWQSGMEVDHRIALAVAFEAFPDDRRRRWFFGPANLQLLCIACHKAKTREDRALLRLCYDRGEEWARGEVLRRLSDARLLRGPDRGTST